MTSLADAVTHLRTIAADHDTTPETAWAVTTVLDTFTAHIDHVQGLAFAHRWDTTSLAHTVAGQILDVIAEQRRGS